MDTAIIFVCPSSDPCFVGLLYTLLVDNFPTYKLFPDSKDPLNSTIYIVDETFQRQSFGVVSLKHKHVIEIGIQLNGFSDIPSNMRIKKQMQNGIIFTPSTYEEPYDEIVKLVTKILNKF